MVLLSSQKLSSDFTAPDFDLSAIDGKQYSLDSFKEKPALVVIFMCVHCPYVQAIETQIIEIQQQFGEKGVQVIGINPNDANRYPADSLEGMQARATEQGYNFIYLRDESQNTARAYEAVCTPDIYLFNKDRKLAYHGRIQELPQAINALLTGESYADTVIPSQGCSIKWLG